MEQSCVSNLFLIVWVPVLWLQGEKAKTSRARPPEPRRVVGSIWSQSPSEMELTRSQDPTHLPQNIEKIPHPDPTAFLRTHNTPSRAGKPHGKPPTATSRAPRDARRLPSRRLGMFHGDRRADPAVLAWRDDRRDDRRNDRRARAPARSERLTE